MTPFPIVNAFLALGIEVFRGSNDSKTEIGPIPTLLQQEKPQGRRWNLGTFGTKKAAEAHERAVQYFKRH
jgi:hypothetical protein